MREKIYLAPGASGAELSKRLAMHGVNCFNIRIVGAGELARIALMRSGIAIAEDFVSSREETALVAEAVKGETYFGKTTYSDIKEIAGAIRRMRSLVSEGDEPTVINETLSKGIFSEKNAALVSVYKKFMTILSERKLIDSVSLVRKAASESIVIDADFYVIEEYPLTPLESFLLKKLSGEKYSVVSLRDLFGVEEKHLKIKSFKNCYGAPNELETILTDIYNGKKLDKCTVAVADTSTYAQIFFDYALLYDLPITFGCGIPIKNSNPARLLVLYYNWMTEGFFGAASINAMLNSKAFDSKKLQEIYPEPDENFSWSVFYETVGNLRLTNDEGINRKRIADFKKAILDEKEVTDPESKDYKTILRKISCIPFLEVLAKELSLPAEDFIQKYSMIRKGSETNSQKLLMMLDLDAVRTIYDELKVIRSAGIEQATEDMILNVLGLSVGNSKSEEGKLYVTGIDGAYSSVRENLYIAGLSASKYPGSPVENYLLLDADLRLFGEGAESFTSDGKIEKKRERLLSLARLSSGLGSDIYVSYAGLNVSELKKDNASSLVFELYREESGSNATSKELEEHTEKVDYFEPAISKTRKVGESYNEGKAVLQMEDLEEREPVTVAVNLDKEYSPSALNTLFGCPRAFMLGNILGIPQPDEEDPFSVIPANDCGTLAHHLMEELANSDMSLEDFVKLSGDCFDRYILQHPVLLDKDAENEKEQFIDMMETAYRMDPHREVILKEEDIHCVHESGVKLHGYPDRVEKLADGSYLIVDFKSGRNIAHVQDDIDTCLQIVIYAYLMEQQGLRISGGEFRYIRLGETVSCKYDDEMKAQLNEKLCRFKEILTASEFPVSEFAIKRTNDDPDPCKYCKFGMICGKNEEMGGDDDE